MAKRSRSVGWCDAELGWRCDISDEHRSRLSRNEGGGFGGVGVVRGGEGA